MSAGWGEEADVRGSWSRPRTGEDIDDDARAQQPAPLRQRRPLSSSTNQPAGSSSAATLKRDPKRGGSSSKLQGLPRAGSLSKLDKPASLDRGDVVTVHSPRHAAEIVATTSDHGLGERWWE